MWRESAVCNKTPVTVLQEFLQKRGETPTYDVICSQTGTHENLFKFKVTACGQSAIGSGKSKKESKHDAAKNLLNQLLREGQTGIYEVAPQQNQLTSPYEESIKENTIGQLQDFCIVNKFHDPKYETIRDEGLPHDKVFGVRCTVSNMFCDAEARTKKQAKHLAAKEMLKKLTECSSMLLEKPNSISDQVTVSDEVFKKVAEVGVRKVGPTVALGKNLADYCNFFKQELFPYTDVIDSLKAKTPEEIAKIENPLGTLQEMIEQMDTSMEIENYKSPCSDIVTLITIKTTPEWMVFGIANTEEESKKKAVINALLFVRKMYL